MPRNGSGVYSLPAGNPVVTGTTISSSGWANPTLSDIAAAITASIAIDGQTVPTANLPMGNFRHLNVANGQNTNEYATVGQIQTAGFQLLGGTAGTINTNQSIAAKQITINETTNSSSTLYINASSDTNGACFKMLGNGSSTPSKTLRVYNGAFQVINDAFSSTVFSVDDLGNVFGSGVISGANITGTSDENLKEDWRPMARDFLERMAGVLHGTFAWKESGDRSAGAGAQSLRKVFPEAVHEAPDGTLSIAYGHAALVTVLELIPLVLRLLEQHGETP